MNKQFITPQERYVTIKITDDTIYFYWTESLKRNKDSSEFYWIVKDEWNDQRTGHNWKEHMKYKNWFTDEMMNFINENTLQSLSI